MATGIKREGLVAMKAQIAHQRADPTRVFVAAVQQ